ncbi:MAG: CGLD27 family protein [Oscillatoriales cyanobacterium C42_A2020_001]|nr:CGLD27 family protein [Leptolyngbyaceae cyanobacterium C42_A2020_001]
MTKNSSPAGCPVPSEQLPLNQYEELRESWFFRWALLDTNTYIRKMVWIWVGSWAIAGPVAAASFSPTKFPVQFLLAASAGAILFLFLALTRLYLGWAYVSSRLVDTIVVYEESGWYDGQTWEKPAEVLTRDRLVVSYQIQPLLKRMQQTFAVLTGLLLLGAISWRLV